MREIKFRGKRRDNGDWVYGHIVKELYHQDHWQSHKEVEYYIHTGHFDANKKPVKYEVIPETVGQFTGLEYGEGVEMYEGDIVQFYRSKDTPFEEIICGEIEYGQCWDYDGETCMLAYQIKTENGYCFLDVNTIYKRIGNIHDNPEMLERK